MKIIRYLIIGITGILLYTLLIMGLTNLSVAKKEKFVDTFGETSYNVISTSSEMLFRLRNYFLFPRLYKKNSDTISGFVKYTDYSIKEKLLISYSPDDFEYIIDLLNINNEKVLKRWQPDMKNISEMSFTSDSRFDKGEYIIGNHPLMLKDSSIIFNTEYSMVKINANSELEWLNNEYEFHHSLELDDNNHLWGCGRPYKSPLKGFFRKETDFYTKTFIDDYVIKLDVADGKVLFSKSFVQILIDNNLEYLISMNGHMEVDPIHLNDIEPALYDGKYWKKGDLILSSRHLSAIFIYRPSTNKIIWYKQGPWLNQHDPDFLDDNKIVVFGNQVFRGQDGYFKKPNENIAVYFFNFDTQEITEPYKRMIDASKMESKTEGRCDILPNGDIFIEETNNARIIFGDSINKKIEYVKRIDSEYIAYINWSRIILE